MTAGGRVARTAAAALFAAILALLGWSVLIEPARLVVRPVLIHSRGWPAGRAPLRIAVLTDLHVGSFRNGLDRLADVVERTNEQNADVVLLLGDYIQGHAGARVPPEEIATRLARLHAPDGVVSVLGNHDWWYDGQRVRQALERVGIRVLENDAVAVGTGPSRFWVAGVGDLYTRPVGIAAALSTVPAGEPVILLSHNPDVFPGVPPRVALTLAGHTHGGQVALPWIGRPIVPSQYGQRYAYGLVVEEGRLLYVSPGIGTSIVPVRFRVPPEITVVTLASP